MTSRLLVLLLLASTVRAAESKPATLSCHPTGKVFQQTVRFRCVLTNLLDEPLLVMLQPFAAEGPTDADRFDWYSFSYWDRYENIFQYDRTSNGSLDQPILGQPIVHLTSEAIRDLRQVPPKACVQIDARWSLPQSLPRRREEWHARVKLMVISVSAFARAVKKTAPDCQLMASTVKKPVDGQPVEMNVRYHSASDPMGYNDDRCHDRISEAFAHIPSPPFRFTTTPAAPPPAAAATH
jgi:hypothetical protein